MTFMAGALVGVVVTLLTLTLLAAMFYGEDESRRAISTTSKRFISVAPSATSRRKMPPSGANTLRHGWSKRVSRY